VTVTVRPSNVLSRETLKEALLSTASLVERRRCGDIADGLIDGYVALNWMEWNGGSLRLTVTGQNVRKQLTAGVG
jgi:predicted RNase H-like nuclease